MFDQLFLIYMFCVVYCLFVVMVLNCTIKQDLLHKLSIMFVLHAILFSVWIVKFSIQNQIFNF